jgi:phosphoglycerate dehydrogenase-like enzyme
MAQRYAGFNMRIKAYDPLRDTVPHDMGYVEMTTLDNLLRQSDFVSIHAVLNRETHKMNVKNGDILESMGKIVNRLPYGELPYTLDE